MLIIKFLKIYIKIIKIKLKCFGALKTTNYLWLGKKLEVGKELPFISLSIDVVIKQISMSIVWKSLKWLAIGVAGLVILYFMGPSPSAPQFLMPKLQNASSLESLELQIAQNESSVEGLKPGNEAKIIWANPAQKSKTHISFLYLHGFGGSHREGSPVNIDLAHRFGGNLFMARLSEHGVDRGDNNFLNFTADNFVESGERALHVAQQLGDSVVIVATSAGAALGLFLASRHPEIKALITYSPCIEIFRSDAKLMAGPWGLQLAHLTTGKDHNDWIMKPGQKGFWTNHQRFEGIIQFATFLKYTMTEKTFEKVNCPLFMGYYYLNEDHQDKTVSVKAMQRMYTQLGTPEPLKRKIAFEQANDHVIASDITTNSCAMCWECH
jgi:esterase/lipase